MKRKPLAPLIVAPRPSAAPAQAEPLTAVQLERRRQMAQLLCLRAANETSRAMARRLCRQWFPKCTCECGRPHEN